MALDYLEFEITGAEHLASPGVLPLLQLARTTAHADSRACEESHDAARREAASVLYNTAVRALYEALDTPGKHTPEFILELVALADEAAAKSGRTYDVHRRIGHLRKPLPGTPAPAARRTRSAR